MKKLIAISVLLFLSFAVFSQVEVEEENNQETFIELDEAPKFTDGEEALMKYLSENINYPEKAKEKGIQGTVYAQFTIEKDGNITSVKIVRGIGFGCDEEVIRVIEIMPKWIPGKSDGENVRAKFHLPVKFKLDESTKIESNQNSNNSDNQDTDIIVDTPEEADIEQSDEDPVFVFLEDAPKFKRGKRAIKRYLVKNIKYPQEAMVNGIEGTVHITFVVEKDGSLTNVKVLRGIGYGCDEEALRVIKSMPKWKPGKQRGNVVRAQFNIPVKFVLEK